MKRVLLLFLSALAISNAATAQTTPALKSGDLVFQNLTCGELCQAILAVTPCQTGKTFNHCGIVNVTDSGSFVIEAIGSQVAYTPMKTFVGRNENTVWFARLQGNENAKQAAVPTAMKYLGRPYDDAFLPDNEAIYCSELVWESYQENGRKLFRLEPMTFKAPGTDSTFAGWQNYYHELGVPVPEGVPGISPCAIANEPFIEWLGVSRR